MIPDFLVIGGGIIGLNIARQLKRSFPDSKVVVIEKEKNPGLHASGRNSGVLHAGFYYTSDSLKARFTRLGNKLLTDYCEEKRIPLNKCGKLVVAKDKNDLVSLDELFRRGKVNGVHLEMVSETNAKLIEPRTRTFERAIFSPATSSVDPLRVIRAMEKDAAIEGVELHYGVRYLRKSGDEIVTSAGVYKPGYIVNAAGLYADQVALDFGFSEAYRILPFKGLYLYSDEPQGSIRTNVYPVPNLLNPFLGVHFTVTSDGFVKIGPTAIPAFWREQYHRFNNFNLSEFIRIIIRDVDLFVYSDFDFRRLALEEIKKYSRSIMVSMASVLVEGVKKENFRRWGKPGLRAQLVNIKKRKLEMDFILEGDRKSMHVLNAVSPGFTCSIPFSQFVCKEINSLLN